MLQVDKETKKRNKNENKNRVDTKSLELRQGMNVLLQGVKSRLWNIEGIVKKIRLDRRSAYIYVPEKERTYLSSSINRFK